MEALRERFTIVHVTDPAGPTATRLVPRACRAYVVRRAAAVAIKGQGLDGTHTHCDGGGERPPLIVGGACGIPPGSPAPGTSAASECLPVHAAATASGRGVGVGAVSGGSSAPAGGSSKPVVSAATALPMLW